MACCHACVANASLPSEHATDAPLCGALPRPLSRAVAQEAPTPAAAAAVAAPAASAPSAVAAAVTAVAAPTSGVVAWKTADVCAWLDAVELGQHTEAFKTHSVDGKLLLTLSEQDLYSTLGVASPLHRKKILMEIASLRKSYLNP